MHATATTTHATTGLDAGILSTSQVDAHAFEIRYASFFNEGRALSFPCDADGRVDCDGLSERARLNYFFARAMVGREFAPPALQRRAQ